MEAHQTEEHEVLEDTEVSEPVEYTDDTPIVQKERYFGSVRFFKNMILLAVIIMIAVPTGLSVHTIRELHKTQAQLQEMTAQYDEMCRSESRVREMTKWVKEALFGCFGGKGGRFIMVGNLIGKNSVLQKIIDSDTVHTSSVNAIDKNGNPAWPERYTIEYLKGIEQFMGYRSFQKEYMNNPITEGAVFSEQWIRYKKMLKLHLYESIVVYVDPSWKSSGKNDYKACKMWGRPKKGLKTAKPTELHCIRAFVRQCSVGEMVRWLYDLYEAIPEDAAVTFYMEANFMQDTILDEFEREGAMRGYQLPILPDKRKKPDKYARIEAISPLWERGCVYYNEKLQNDPDMKAGIEQTLSFEQGSRAHDDSPDADEGAIWKLQKQVREETFQPRLGVRQLPDNAW